MRALIIRNVFLSVLFLLAVLALEANNTPAPARAADASVTIDNFTFDPPELTVAVGTTVKWGQSRRHTAHRGREEQGLPVEGARH